MTSKIVYVYKIRETETGEIMFIEIDGFDSETQAYDELWNKVPDDGVWEEVEVEVYA